MLPSEILAIVPLDEPSPAGYMNVYEQGDIWEKIKGCVGCKNNCCGNCPLSGDFGCYLHLVNRGQDKPFHCVVHPSPIKHKQDCILQYRCVKGTQIGRIRNQGDPRNILRDEETGEKIEI